MTSLCVQTLFNKTNKENFLAVADELSKRKIAHLHKRQAKTA